jgi:hemolysin activation/secretion protein
MFYTQREVAGRRLRGVYSRTKYRPRVGNRFAIRVCAIALLVAAATPGFAQQAPRAPQTDLGSTEKRFDALENEERRAKNRAVPLPSIAAPSTPAADTKPLFGLTGVVVEGSALLPGDVVAAAYRSYLGKAVSQADLVAITRAISDRYRDAGYHLTRAIVPPQDIQGGRVRIQVIEGRIADIVLKGERAAQFGVRKVLDPVVAERTSRSATLERQLLLVNDIPGIRIADTAIEEIGTGSGRFRLTVHLESWRNYTLVSLDNRGTAAIGPLQSFFSSSFNSYLVAGDTFGVNASTTPSKPDELGFGRLFYNAPVGIDGARVGFVASYGLERPGDERSAIDTRDQSQTYELRGSIVPIRTRDASLWLTGAAGVGEFDEDTVFGPNYRDRIRTVSLTADYQMHDWLHGWNYWTVGARQGLPVLGASERGDPFLSRDDASGTFSKLNIYYTRYQPLSNVWSVKMSFAGQLVSSPLLAAEEFYLGSPFGRGWYGEETGGDNAVGGSLELRFDQTLNNSFLKGYQLYGYIDRTVAWNFHSDGDVLSLTLTGVGARFYLPNDLQAGVEVATPLEYHIPDAQPRDTRAFFYVSKVFKLCPGSAQMHCS